jgi:DNA polymerase-3 subunit epsilon
MMHLKLNDITDKQFSLNQLSEIYKIPQREKFFNRRRYKTALLFLKLKSRLELNKPIVG